MPDLVADLKHQLQHLAAYLAVQREVILDTWRAQVQQDPQLHDVSRWTRSQFDDHIPFVLETFGHKLMAWPGEDMLREEVWHGEVLHRDVLHQEEHQRETVAAHSRHRWQRGYDLRSLVREWGHLNSCLVNEFYNYAAPPAHAQPAPCREAVLREAHHCWAQFLNEYISANVVEYHHLVQAQAATRVHELEQALQQVRALEAERATILRTAAHDLRGGLSIVMGTASMMETQELLPAERTEFHHMVKHSVNSLNAMLTDLMSMARLEAGQEKLQVEPFDAGQLLTLLCSASQHLAEERGLFLRWQGPDTLPVAGDAVKVQRIAQNLLLNGLKYTRQGGVTLTWGEATPASDGWELGVEDTGPGLRRGTAAPLACSLEAATAAAHAVEGVTLSAPTGLVEATPEETPEPLPAVAPGEGIGLSIVKGLCELLQASIELQTTAGVGSKFRLVFPKQYQV